MSLRVAPEHHQLLRDIATALRTRPELADVLRDVLQAQHDARVPVRDTDVLQPFIERLEITRQFTERIMAFAENINERVKALEQPEAMRNTDGNTDVLQSILDRIAALEEREPRMVRIEALEARITALEEPPASRPHTPRPSSAGKRRSPKGVTGEPPP